MGDRAKSSISTVYDLLSSRRLNVFLAAAAAAYALLLVVWAATSPSETVYRIGTSLPFKLVLFLFTINNLLCLVNQFKRTVALCRVDLRLLEQVSTGPRFVSEGPVGESAEKLAELKRKLRRRGFRFTRLTNTGFLAVRGRFSPLATIAFHAALFLLVLGVILGSIFSVQGTLALAEGESFLGAPAAYAMVEPNDKRRSLPRVSLRVEKIRPRFWEQRLLFTDLYADIGFPADKPVEKRRIRLNVPWKPAWDTYVSLVGLGHAPRYELSEAGGQVVDEGFVKLSTFPPGTRDSFITSVGGYRVDTAIYTDFARQGKQAYNRSLYLRRPAYHVRISGPDGTAYRGTVRPHEFIPLKGGLRLRFPEVRYWGQFRVIRNAGLPFLWVGFLFISGAAVWRLFFYQKQIAAVIAEDGRLIVGAKFDYYRAVNEVRLQELLENIFKIPFTRQS